MRFWDSSAVVPLILEEVASGRMLRELSLHWTEVEPVAPVREVAIRLVGVHDLRAADALQRRKKAWSSLVRVSNDNKVR